MPRLGSFQESPLIHITMTLMKIQATTAAATLNSSYDPHGLLFPLIYLRKLCMPKICIISTLGTYRSVTKGDPARTVVVSWLKITMIPPCRAKIYNWPDL